MQVDAIHHEIDVDLWIDMSIKPLSLKWIDFFYSCQFLEQTFFDVD